MSNHKMVEGRVCIVTGAGRGIGREYALMLGAHGGLVVVNDLGASRDGSGGDSGPAQDVANEIKAAGGYTVRFWWKAQDETSWEISQRRYPS